MAVNIVTGMTGKAHITSDDDRAKNASIFGTGKYVLDYGSKFEPTTVTNNQIRIRDGMCINQGTQMGIELNDYEDVTIQNGVSGSNRNDLIVMRYERNEDTGIEKASLVVIRGGTGSIATDPPYNSGNILDGGDLIDDMPLFRVKIESLSITAVEPLFVVFDSLDQISETVSEMIESGVYEKIESEVATDFSEAETPEFQQNIDDISNSVSELKADLDDLTVTTHNIISDMPNLLGERMEKASSQDTFNVNPSNWGTRQMPLETGDYFGIFDIYVENVNNLPIGAIVLASLRNSDSLFSVGNFCFTDLSLYPSNLVYKGNNVSKRIYCKFTINSSNNYLLGARVSGSGDTNKTIAVTFTNGAIFKLTNADNDSQEMFDYIDMYEKYGYKDEYIRKLNVSDKQITNMLGYPTDKEGSALVLNPIIKGNSQNIGFRETNIYKYPNLPVWGHEYLEHWYERVYEGIADSAIISLEGDSITQGYAPINTNFPDECFANMRGYAIKKIMKAGNYPMNKLTVFNNGHGGRSTCEWVGNAIYGSTTYVPQYPNGFLDIGMQREPDLMIIAYGMNDADSTNTRFPKTIEDRINLFGTNMREGLERIRGNVSVNDRPSYNKSVKDLSIIICMPTVADWDATGRNNNKWNQYLRDIIQKLCREYYCAFVDMTMRTYDHKMDGSKCWSVHDAGTQPTSGSLGIHPNKWSNAQTMAMLQDLIFPTTMWIMDTSDF